MRKLNFMQYKGKAKILLLCLLALIALYFVVRGPLLRYVFSKTQAKLKTNYGLVLNVKSIKFSGLKTVNIRNLDLSLDTDTLLVLDSLTVNPRLFPMITGKIRMKEISLQHGRFNFDITHLRNIKKKSSLPEDSTSAVPANFSYSKFSYNLISRYFKYVPNKLFINNFIVAYKRDTLHLLLGFSQFKMKSREFAGNIDIKDNQLNEKVLVAGTMDASDNTISFKLINQEKRPIELPYIKLRWNTKVSFDSIGGYFGVERYSGNRLELKLSGGISNFIVQNEQIGPDPVVTKAGSGSLKLAITERAVEIDSSSVLTFNHFSFSPYFKYEKNPNRVVYLKFIKKEFEAADLFQSLPDGLFSEIQGLQTKGKLIYSLNFMMNLDKPDSIILDSKLDKKDFAIVKYGNADFRKMNGSFLHEVYEKGRLVRTFIVGPENPDFTPLDQISPYIKYCVLTSEDGDFFYHHGFNQDAFKNSISLNFKEKRFARGGSTISMQLVKNVFLSRKKTIARKLEEMIIVWMIENLRLSSKDRMFEVYMNIIEWGPDIYGVKEASRFYFNKLPSQLNLKESIYLSSIIPRPKGFKYTFDTAGHLRDYYAGYYRLLTGIMLRRNQITPIDTLNLNPAIELTGAAKYYLTQPDTLREDSIFFIEPRGLMLDASPLKVQENQ